MRVKLQLVICHDDAHEETVTDVIQQMAWSKEGAHLLLQTRVRTLNRELDGIFKRWYPDLDIKAEEIRVAA